MTSVAACLRREIAAHRGPWLAIMLAFTVAFQMVQLALLIVRFGKFPNYLTVHDWPANVWRIIRSTPAIADMIPIILDEWLIEIGSMNYAFGHGIAEWSFVLLPAKLFVVLALAILFATDLILLRAVRKTCNLSTRLGTVTAAGAGTLLAGAASMTITWVVCCAAPTWVVGLAILGLSTTAALALQPIGGWLVLAGVAALGAPAIGLAAMLCERTAHSRATGNPAGSPVSCARPDVMAGVTP
jgi:hypothetical protein